MPYHSEHHAWPNVPFHVLPEVHKKIKDLGTRPRSKCNPGGEDGFLSMHWILLKDMLSGGSETIEPSEDKKVD
jgi:fatty acid desaturase